jgi:hypothetical protein
VQQFDFDSEADMGRATAALFALSLAACGTSVTTHDLLSREVGRTIADVTLVAGPPQFVADLPDGSRDYRWERWSLVPRGGPRCLYTLHTVQEGRPASLASWRVVGIDPPAPGCPPLLATS